MTPSSTSDGTESFLNYLEGWASAMIQVSILLAVVLLFVGLAYWAVRRSERAGERARRKQGPLPFVLPAPPPKRRPGSE